LKIKLNRVKEEERRKREREKEQQKKNHDSMRRVEKEVQLSLAKAMVNRSF